MKRKNSAFKHTDLAALLPETEVQPFVNRMADAMAGMLTAAGYHADFDVSSLGRLDDLIRDNMTDGCPTPGGFFAPPHRGPDASVEARSGALGAYLGESLRRRYGGEWRMARPGEPWPWGPVLQFPNGFTTDPVQAVVTRIEGGPAVSDYVTSVAAMAEGRLPDAGAAAGSPNLATVSKRTVAQATRQLVEARFLEVTTRGDRGRGANTYLLFPARTAGLGRGPGRTTITPPEILGGAGKPEGIPAIE